MALVRVAIVNQTTINSSGTSATTMMKTTTLQEKIVIETIHNVKGFQAVGVHSGLRRSQRPDFCLIYSQFPCAAAGVFTTNQVKAAPVLLNMQHLAENGGDMRAVVTNAANANACTGEQGMQNAQQTAEWVAEQLELSPQQVFVQSTGVIGVQLPMDKIANGINLSVRGLNENGWDTAMRGIMTTDTRPKAYSIQSPNGYTITAIAKGSGMIAPNMATMLAIITTDAAIEQPKLQEALWAANGVTFNRISVDGDTSTNDTVLALANGASGVTIDDENYATFVEELTELCTKLAHMIVLDGEGATKFITIDVVGAEDDEQAHRIANTIATSPLVKTAFYGADANWGRILAAAGRSGVVMDQHQLDLWFDTENMAIPKLQVVSNGTPTDYEEAEAAMIFQQDDIVVTLSVGSGGGKSMVWTCDLSHDYVSINADYRT